MSGDINGPFSISREQRETEFHYAEARKVAYKIRTYKVNKLFRFTEI